MVREKTRGSKLEGAFKKRKGTLLEHSKRTLTFFPVGRTQAPVIFKRDKEYDNQQPCCFKWQPRRTSTIATTQNQRSESAIESDVPFEIEMPQLDEMASQPKATSDSEAGNENLATNEEQIKVAKVAMKELKQKTH